MKKRIPRTFFLKVALLVCFMLFAIGIHQYVLTNDTIRNLVTQFGYAGMLVLGIISGFNIAVPIPAISFYPLFVSLGFSPVLVVAILSVGMLIADALGYAIGSAGRDVLLNQQGQTVVARLDRLHERHPAFPYVVLCIYAAGVPLPNELIVIPMAFAGYRFFPMAVMLFLGNVVFNTIGAVGVAGILSFLS